MDFSMLIKNRRTVRKFKAEAVDTAILEELVDIARVSPSAANLQSLKYAIITDEKTRLELYPFIKYAGYTPEWEMPFEITPTSFIAVFNDTSIRPSGKSEVDAGIALMALTLGAEDKGLASCIIGSVNREKAKEILEIGDGLDLLYLIGIGHPYQSNKLVESEERVKYSLNGKGGFNVPKRTLDEIIIKR